MSRFYRSTREAFPVERFPAVFGPYGRPVTGEKVAGAVVIIVSIIALAALIVHELSK